MAKFCGKCGSPLDEKSGLCPKCNPPKKTPKKHIGLKIVSVFLAVLILFGSVSGVLVYYRIANIPIVASVMDAFGVGYHTKDTNTSDFTYHNTTKEHIEFDSTSGIGYVNNELLITTNKNVTKDELNKVLENIGGTIVGEITALYHYQIQLNKNQKYTELENLIAKLKANEIIASVNYNYAFPVEQADYTPNDKKWKKDWNETPSGTNWGLEAIEAQKAWDSKDKMQSVNIGVIDTMFYTDHEDLKFAEIPLGNKNAEEKYKDEFNSHGTHVSGIIGATFDNNKGIAGITPTSNLYGASIWGICDYGYSTTLTYQIALYYLIEVNNCKAINISMADNLLGFCVAQENGSTKKTATAAMKAYSDEISEFIKILINKGYEFVICVCAGNQNDGNYKYFKKDSTDTQTPYDYYSYSDFQKYLADEESSYDYSLYKDRADEISGRLIEAKNINANGMFAVIEDSEVRNRIIITGAVQNNADKNYTIASFSQCGAEVDILAPGVDIYSTSVKKGLFGNLKSTYEDMSGTSQATPIATAVSGLVFSINPDLTGAEVKNIICSSGVGSYGQEKYKLLNAKNAVDKALNSSGGSATTDITNSEVIKQYREAIKNNFYSDVFDGLSDDWDSIGEFVNGELLSASRYTQKYQVFYALTDVNKDGISEMVIGAGENKNSISIYDFFAFDGQKPVQLYEVGYRVHLTIYDNGIFLEDGSGSAFSHSYEYSELPANSTSLKFIDGYSRDNDVFSQVDSDFKTVKTISETEFNAALEKYKSNELALNWVEITADDKKPSPQNTAADKLFNSKISDLSSTYGTVENKNFSKTVAANTDPRANVAWANINGVIGEAIFDFDNDGQNELLIVRMSNDSENRTKEILEIYEVNNGSVSLTDSRELTFGVFGNLESMNLGTYIAEVNDKKYICVESLTCGIMTDYSDPLYYVFELSNGKIKDVMMIEDTLGGTGQYEYTMHTWDKSSKKSSVVIDTYQYDEIKQQGVRSGKYSNDESPILSAFKSLGFPTTKRVLTDYSLYVNGGTAPCFLEQKGFTAVSLYKANCKYESNNVKIEISTKNYD